MSNLRQSDITRMLKAVRAAGETVYAIRTSWREIDGREVQEVEIVTREAEKEAPTRVTLG